MGTAGNALIKGGVDDIIDELNSFYCYHRLVWHWADGVRNRLEGMAAYLLGGELDEVGQQAGEAAEKLTARITELDGAPTADPRRLVEESPLDDFALPDNFSDPSVIVRQALERIQMIIGRYGAFLERIKDRDPITHRLVVGLLRTEVQRETEIEAVLT